MNNNYKIIIGILVGVIIMFIFNMKYKPYTDNNQYADSLLRQNTMIIELSDSINKIHIINDSLYVLYNKNESYMDSIEKELSFYDSVIAKINTRDENYFIDTLSVYDRVEFFKLYYQYRYDK